MNEFRKRKLVPYHFFVIKGGFDILRQNYFSRICARGSSILGSSLSFFLYWEWNCKGQEGKCVLDVLIWLVHDVSAVLCHTNYVTTYVHISTCVVSLWAMFCVCWGLTILFVGVFKNCPLFQDNDSLASFAFQSIQYLTYSLFNGIAWHPTI